MTPNKKIMGGTVKSALLIGLGLWLGWLVFKGPSPHTAEAHGPDQHTEKQIWTCSMHPQIRKNEPGLCPICAMDLIPLAGRSNEEPSPEITLSDGALHLAEVRTSKVSRQPSVKTISLFGKVTADERLVKTQTAHFSGRIEQLFINVTGEKVKLGQPIADIYSPALVTAQKELLEAIKLKDSYPELLEASRNKLRQWKLHEDQIAELEQNTKVRNVIQIFSHLTGIVLSKKVNQGDHVAEGTPLYDIADLSRVWVTFDAYENDLIWIKIGDVIQFSVQSEPGKLRKGKVTFIDPVINPATRIARVRIEVENKSGDLLPEMFVNGTLQTRLDQFKDHLVIPKTAVLWTGTRSLVYVKQPASTDHSFQMREIVLGPSLGNSYIVHSGLTDGEEIVTHGTFNVDAAAQLAGKPSMMNPEEQKPIENHNH